MDLSIAKIMNTMLNCMAVYQLLMTFIQKICFILNKVVTSQIVVVFKNFKNSYEPL